MGNDNLFGMPVIVSDALADNEALLVKPDIEPLKPAPDTLEAYAILKALRNELVKITRIDRPLL